MGLFSTRSFKPSCAMRIMVLGLYASLNLATGQSDVHVPHWKHLRSFSLPCIRESSYLNLGSSSDALIARLLSSWEVSVSVIPLSP